MNIFTIGHSKHPLEEFPAISNVYGIERLIDIRTVPGSRTNPRFNRDTFSEAAGPRGHRVRLAALGGLRRARPDSTKIRNALREKNGGGPGRGVAAGSEVLL